MSTHSINPGILNEIEKSIQKTSKQKKNASWKRYIKQLNHYIKSSLVKVKPDTVIVHIGSDDSLTYSNQNVKYYQHWFDSKKKKKIVTIKKKSKVYTIQISRL